MRAEAISLLRNYTEAPGAPGHEDAVRRLFHEALKDKPEHQFETDRNGSVLCRRTNDDTDAPRVMLTAHMDEVAFMVQNITEQGFIQFVPLGGWWPHTVLAQPVKIIRRDGLSIPGVITSTPPHFLSAEARNNLLTLEQMYIDVGAENREQAIKDFGIRLGDSIVPATTFQALIHRDRYMSKAFDNRVGMAALTQVMRILEGESLPNQLLGVATVQEEIGCRGAQTATTLAKPDVALVLEGPPADDTPGFIFPDSQGALGKGVQIRVMDPGALSSRTLVEFAIETAEQAKIPYQVTVRRGGGTDARSIQLRDLGVPCVVLGVPARYIHSHNTIVDIRDYLEMVKLSEALIRALDANAIAKLVDFLL